MPARRRKSLKLRRLAIDTYHENVAFLHRDCPLYRTEGFQALMKIEVVAGKRRVLAVLNVVDDETIIATDELGLSEQAFAQLGIKEERPVRVAHAQPPQSLEAVHRKISGDSLSHADFHDIAQDILDNRYSKMEIAAFLVASSQAGLEREEILGLTRAMVDTGERLDWGESLVADKHCIGGIPGNRTSMLIVPIVAAHGILIPKTSSRAITSPAGTADTMELLAEVELLPHRLKEIVHQQRGCLAWGGTARLAPLDDILISVERPLSMDSPGQLVASILSKKVAAGATHLLIDIPTGPTAKVRHVREALALRKLFEYVGGRMGLHVEVMVTDGRQPIGRGIGPVLELRDIMQILENDPVAPQDLRQKALRLAGRIIEFDPDVRGGAGYAIARDILDSGRALDKMRDIIACQGPRPRLPKPGRLRQILRAPKAGVITTIDNLQTARIARLAGAPMDKGAGVDLFVKLGQRVRKGDPLYRIHAEFPADFRFARDLAAEDSGIGIGGRGATRAGEIVPWNGGP